MRRQSQIEEQAAAPIAKNQEPELGPHEEEKKDPAELRKRDE